MNYYFHFRSLSFYADCIPIKDIRPNLKNINVVFIVLEVGPPTLTKENRIVRTFKVGDPTACINVSVWDEPGNLLVPGDIVRLTKGYASIWRSCLTLCSGKNGDILKVGDFCMGFNEQINMSEPNPNLQQLNPINQQMNTINQQNSVIMLNNGGTPNNGNGNNRLPMMPSQPNIIGPPQPQIISNINNNSTPSGSVQTKPTNQRASGGEHSKSNNSNPKTNAGRAVRNNQVKGNGKGDRR